MIASLPMYDRPETAAANDRLWALIRTALEPGIEGLPDHLTRDGADWDHWQSPDLLLSQTCGFPYRTELHGKVTLVASPIYGLPDCAPGYYNSVLIVHRDQPRADLRDFEHSCLAYNDPRSQSGWAAPQSLAQSLGFRFQNTRCSGSHVASARAVAAGDAAIAALDAQSWRLIQLFDGFASDLREIARTAPSPGLPYITGRADLGPALRRALASAIKTLPAADRDLLGLTGVTFIGADQYLAVATPPGP